MRSLLLEAPAAPLQTPLGRCVAAVLLTLMTFLLATGCIRVGPNYLPPAVQAPEQWQPQQDQFARGDGEVLQKWWRVFADPMLTQLISEAARGNLDLKTAVARVKEARARIGVVSGVYYPQIDAVGEFSRQHGSENSIAGIGMTADRNALGLEAGWEIDLFGRISRSVEAATADFQAKQEDLRDVQVVLLAEVALSYLLVRTLQARLAATEGNIASQRQVLGLTQTRFRYGLATDLDVAQAEDVLANSEAQVPPLRSLLVQAMNNIALLLGKAPGAAREMLTKPEPLPSLLVEVAVGVPTDLLRQRPDIRRAERELAAQTARIGVATADLYPKLSLLGTVGFEASNIGDLFNSSSHFYSLGPNIRWNVFAGGSIRSQIQVEDAKAQQALLQYEQTVLDALREAENAMTAYVQEQVRVRALERSAAASRRTLSLALQLYKDGLRDFQNVLDAERNVFEVDNRLAEARGNVAINLVQLYKALGGGWRTDAASEPMAMHKEQQNQNRSGGQAS